MADSDDLLALMQAGDMLALDRIARAYSTRLLAVARRQCHLPDDAKDAVQQALVAASTSMTGIRSDGSPLAWLSTLVARNCSRLNRRVGVTEELTDAPCGCDDPQAMAERRELAASLSDALMALPRTDRLMVLLSAEGFNGVELAERFGLSHDAVRGRLKRARKILRDTLSPVAGTSVHDPTPAAALHR